MTEQQMADLQAERATLGAMMASAEVAEQVIEVIRSSADFYDPRHGIVYATLVGRLAVDGPVDEISLARALQESGDLAKLGGSVFLHELQASVPVAAMGAHYAGIVADWAIRRRIRTTAIRLDQFAADVTRNISDVVNAAQAAVHEATVPRATSSEVLFGDLLDETIAEIFDPSVQQRGLSTGIGALDDSIGGLKPGQLILVAARPGVGKSILTAGFARSAAMHRNVPSVIFSLEMAKGEVMRRLLSAETSIGLSKILRSELSLEERAKLTGKVEAVRGAPLFIDDTRQSDISTIRASARRLQQRHGLGLCVVDYLQLMGTTPGVENRAQALGEVSRGLKILAGDLQAPVVAAAQLNRLAEQRSDRRPQLSDLRESGSLEQDADVVILLHRPDYQNPESERAGEIDLIVAKNRNGPEETITVSAQLDRARIVDIRI